MELNNNLTIKENRIKRAQIMDIEYLLSANLSIS